jgi:F0F1-type ATP synthase membrane subunit b/b'
MENFNTFIAFVVIVFGLLQLILFFKIWGMTNNVREIKEYICKDLL